MQKSFKILAILIVVFFAWWTLTTPNKAIKIGEAYSFKSAPRSVVSVTPDQDFILEALLRDISELPPYDEVVLVDDEKRAIVTAVDGWFWEVDLTTGTARQFLDAPLMPAGARLSPVNDRVIYFCSSRLYGVDYPVEDRVGLYQMDIDTKLVTPLVLDVPLVSGMGEAPKVYTAANAPRINNSNLEQHEFREFKFCNDLDVSADGRRIYFTEPFSYGEPSMGGGGTYREAISLGRNGLVWKYDLDTNETSLVSQNFTFPDGVLVETNAEGGEDSILIAETVKFRIVRMFISGDRAGSYETLWENLPAMPDGMDRDSQGRIWVGMLKQRSNAVTWIHNNPWIKPLLLRLPSSVMPISPKTSILGLSADASEAIFYSEHDGSKITDISVVIPGKNHLYLATVGDASRGLYKVPYPAGLMPGESLAQ